MEILRAFSDNPESFAQVYARLSIPINKSDGIAGDAANPEWYKRTIIFRNVFLQMTYGNTDKFKLYSFDSAQTRYVNRLDLLAHSYFNANLTLNLLTFIMPRTFRRANRAGNRMHMYLDGFTSLVLTNVYDTSKKFEDEVTKYNVKTPIFGLNLKGSWEEGRWRLELATRRYWIFPSTNTFNTKMNPQQSNVKDIFLPGNTDKPLESTEKKVKAFYNIESVISYKTAADPVKNDSRVFLRYSYNSNSPSIASTRYSNNYFQFQIGYSFEVTKLFKPESK